MFFGSARADNLYIFDNANQIVFFCEIDDTFPFGGRELSNIFVRDFTLESGQSHAVFK